MEPVFCDKREISKLTGMSCELLKASRFRGDLTEGIHYQRFGPTKIVYNRALLIDWVSTRNNPRVHQLAIDAFLASLPSSKAAAAITPKGRKPNTRKPL
jgi:hypothetical protein